MKQWYVLRVRTNLEKRVQKTLKEKAEQVNKDQYFGEVLVPTKDEVKVVNGKKRTLNKVVFPGYAYVEMEVTPDSVSVLRSLREVSGFACGNWSHPMPISQEEVDKLRYRGENNWKVAKDDELCEGDMVQVLDGPFNGMKGKIAQISGTKAKVEIQIFGKSTPVEMSLSELDKLSETRSA